MSSSTAEDGVSTITPGLKRSGGNTSGAAAKLTFLSNS